MKYETKRKLFVVISFLISLVLWLCVTILNSPFKYDGITLQITMWIINLIACVLIGPIVITIVERLVFRK